jgi:nucleotide-binding universal stress UspA family protein
MSEHTGPVIIAYDGSAASEQAMREAAQLLAPRTALVVVVWESGAAFNLWAPPLEPAPIDIRTALEIDRALLERSQRLAEQGAEVARQLGLDASGLAVADIVTVSDTITRLAGEHDAPAIVVGAHGHSGLREALLGSTSRDLVRHAPCPVIVVRGDGKHLSARGANPKS